MSRKKSSQCGDFGCPVQKLVFDTWKDGDKHKAVIDLQAFSHSVSLIIPGAPSRLQRDKVTSAIVQQRFYKVEDLPILKLIDVEFIEAFVKKGNLFMLSCDDHIDTSDLCVALHPPGKLVLNVSKEIYEQLGLEGKPSRFNKKLRCKYVVTVDLTHSSFRPEKKNYKRVEWCLANRLGSTSNFITSWVPFDGSICPSSIGAYFTSCGFQSTECKQRQVKKQLNELRVPIVDYLTPEPCDGSGGYHEFYEWLGFTACSCDNVEPDGFITSYGCPEPTVNVPGGAWLTKLSGMQTPYSILETIERLRNLISENNIPWVSLTTHGFADSPVCATGYEHGFHVNGDNLLTFVLFPNNCVWLYSAFGSNDCVT